MTYLLIQSLKVKTLNIESRRRVSCAICIEIYQDRRAAETPNFRDFITIARQRTSRRIKSNITRLISSDIQATAEYQTR